MFLKGNSRKYLMYPNTETMHEFKARGNIDVNIRHDVEDIISMAKVVRYNGIPIKFGIKKHSNDEANAINFVQGFADTPGTFDHVRSLL